MSGVPIIFYRKGAKNLELKTIPQMDSIRNLTPAYFATTYNESKQRRSLLDSLGYKPILYSSRLIWNINKYLDTKKINTINDIWILYKKE